MMPSAFVVDADASRKTSPDIFMACIKPESVLVMRRGGEKHNLMIHHYQYHHQISLSSSKSNFFSYHNTCSKRAIIHCKKMSSRNI